MSSENMAPSHLRSPAAKVKRAVQPVDRNTTSMEATLKRLRLERDEARSELKQLEQSHARATSQLAKHAKLLPTLQAKMDELAANHAESRKRKEAEIAREREARKAVQDQLDSVRVELKAAHGERRSLASRLDREERRCQALTDRNVSLESTVEDMRQARDVTAVMTASHFATLSAAHDAELHRLKGSVYSLTLDNARLARHLADKTSQFTLLATFCGEQQQQLELCQSMLDERDADVDRLLDALFEERELRIKEKDWRQRARSDERLIASQQDDIARLESEQVVFSRQHAQWSAHQNQLVLENGETMDRLLAGTTESLEELKDVNVELKETKAHLESTKTTLAETEHSLGKLQHEHDSLVQDHNRLRTEHDELLGSHEELGRVLHDERQARDETRLELEQSRKETDKERADKKRVVALLALSRKATESLTRDLNETNDEVERLSLVERDNADLRIKVDTLSRMKALADVEVEQVTSQNVDLLSHGNANQKIRHIAALRNDLHESRRENVQTIAALKAAKEANEQLRKELEAYKPLDGRRSRATGPDMRDVLLEEDAQRDEDEEEQGDAEVPAVMRRSGPRRVVMFARRSTMGAAASTTGTTTADGPIKKTGTMLLSELV